MGGGGGGCGGGWGGNSFGGGSFQWTLNQRSNCVLWKSIIQKGRGR